MQSDQNKHSAQLNPRQKAASEASRGPLLIVAGAGTGKTKTLTARLAHFIEEGVAPERICAITFTNKAAKEMEERVRKLASPIARKSSTAEKSYELTSLRAYEPLICTFHSLGARILRAEAHNLGRRKNFTIFDGHDSFDLIKKIAKKIAPEKSRESEDPLDRRQKRDTRTPTQIAEKISEIKNKSGSLAELERSRYPSDVLALKAFLLYEKALKDNNAFDFDDLIEKPVALFRAHPDILQKYQNKFDALFVDEYQDVSPAQYELVKLLAGVHRNASFVGDDEQLIYGWRYANLETFLHFERDWPGARVVLLEENYRSTGNIIAAASAVSKNNLARRTKNLWTRNEAGAKIVVAEAMDEDDEAEWIAGKALKLVSSLARLPETMKIDGFTNELKSQRANELSIAVLYRTNAQSRAIEQALIRRGIPYRIFGGLKFYERKEIKDIVAGLRYAGNPADSVSRERLDKNFSMGKFVEISKICAAAADGRVAPVEFIHAFIAATDYLGYLERNFANYAERQENVAELLKFASGFASIGDLLQDIALVQSTDAPSSKLQDIEISDPVHLSTIHLAKGLEFDRVFIAGVSEGLLPHGRSVERDEQLEEERRLMYVAMTRARKELFISFYDIPSRFISEIPQDLIELHVRPAEDEESDDGLDYVRID